MMDERRRPDWRQFGDDSSVDEEESTTRWTDPRREAAKLYQNMRDLDHKDYFITQYISGIT